MNIRAATSADLDAIRRLLREYAAWLNVDLSFQGFEEELAALPGEYAPPSGRLLVAEDAGVDIAGCAALRRIDDEICEMKRLYVPERFRGSGLSDRQGREAHDKQEDDGLAHRRSPWKDR